MLSPALRLAFYLTVLSYRLVYDFHSGEQYRSRRYYSPVYNIENSVDKDKKEKSSYDNNLINKEYLYYDP